MILRYTPEIIKCLILVQHYQDVGYPMDSFLMRTVQNKYFVAIGQKMQNYLIRDFYIKRIAPYRARFPFVQVDPVQGFAMLKCPTINGGEWQSNLNDFSRCDEKVPLTKGLTLNLIISQR